MTQARLLAKAEAWCRVGSFGGAWPRRPTISLTQAVYRVPSKSALQQICLTPTISGLIDNVFCGMRFSIPCRSRNHIETYSRWINAFGLVCVLSAIFWGATLRFHFPSTPLSDPDTWGYFNPALSWLGGQGFQQTAGRSWLSPAILAGILKIGGDFSWITHGQHVQGLLAAGVMWQTFRLWQALSRGSVCRPDRKPDEHESPSSKSARV